MLRQRYLKRRVLDDLGEKMVFVGGARQVGKTTFATRIIAEAFNHPAYLTWDSRADRRRLMGEELPGDADILIFDEIHKDRRWKNLVKGLFDKHRDRLKFLVTGSRRLDVFRRGGDSLQGRYHYYRMHPFSVAELAGREKLPGPFEEIDVGRRDHEDLVDILLRFGGFPEPAVRQSEKFLRRWHVEKLERLFQEDIGQTEQIRDLGSMKLLSDMLPERAGALLSVNAIREDLEVSHRAAAHWLDVLEAFYYHFRIRPFARRAVRSLRKEPKLYLWDWSEIRDEGRRFENMVASHLLKTVHLLVDGEGHRAKLHFLRTVDGKEADFLVAVDGKPWFALEAKLSDASVSRSLLYFKRKLDIPLAYQVVAGPRIDVVKDGVRVVSAGRFLAGLA
jgi:predicted AAA+ superfamily ATPase